MSAPPIPLPDLTPQDAARLDALIAADLCLFSLAETTNTPLRELILWADSPPIAPWLTRLRTLRAAQLRQEMLAHLQHLARTSPDPIESRRAATAALNHLTTARPKPRPAPPEAHGSDPWARRHRSASRIPTIPPQPSTAPRTTASATPPAPIPAPPAIATGCHWSAARVSMTPGRTTSADGATTPTLPPPAIPAPTVLPAPTLTPRHVANHLISTPITPGLAHTAATPVGITRPDNAAHRLTLDSRQDAAPPHARRPADLTLKPCIRASG